MPKCVVCKVPIVGTYQISSLGEALCGAHPNVAGCRWCGRFAASYDGFCAECAHSGVKTDDELQTLANPVLTWLADHLGPHQLDQAKVRLSNAKSLQGAQYAETRWTQDHNGFRAMISVAFGIPQLNAKEALAHEYGHLLLVTNLPYMTYIGPHDLSPEEEEGFCEVIRALWIDRDAGSRRHERRTLLEKNAIDTYRNGFAQMWPRYITAGSISNFRDAVLSNARPSPSQIRRSRTRPRSRIPVINSTSNPGQGAPVLARGQGHRPVIATRNTKQKNQT